MTPHPLACLRVRALVPAVLPIAVVTACAANPAQPAASPPAPVYDAPSPAAPVAPSAATSAGPAGSAPAGAARSDDTPDLAVVHRIKDEAFRRGQVMDTLFHLTDVNGPRLTGSPGLRSAQDWVVKTLGAWGVQNAHLEPWGRWGRAWSVQRFEMSLLDPSYARLPGVPKAWSRGTAGPVTGTLVSAPLFPDRQDEDDWQDLDRLAARIRLYAQTYRGKLRGRFVLLDPARDLDLPAAPTPARLGDKELGDMGKPEEHLVPPPWTYPLQRFPRDPKKRQALFQALPAEVLWDYFDRLDHTMGELWRFLADEGVLGVLGTDRRGEGALYFAENAAEGKAGSPTPPVTVAMPPEDHDRLARLTEKGTPAHVRVDAAVTLGDKDEEESNVVAELPGSTKKDELVLLGGHLDSWHSGTGATDNGAGSAVTMEAMRILETLKLPLARTVRLLLWSGEEQGLFGSRAYVKKHFGDPLTMALLPEHAKVSAYFNLDNGSGKIRGVYLEDNDMARPLFESWLSPFRDEGATTVTLQHTSGTDHQSFDDVGLPGFQFVQDPLDYDSRTHHSSLDVYEHALAPDLMQAAAIVASVVYAAANRGEMVPRKPLPAPIVGAASVPAR